MGTMLMCNNYVRQRLRLEELYPEPTTTFGDCDCISYSYFFLSIVLFSFGSFVTVASLSGGGGNDFIFSNMGHMWLVGPICICSGMMIAIKIILYLRRKSVIQMLLRQRALLRGLIDIAQQAHAQQTGSIVRNPSTLTLPPAYDLLMGASAGPFEVPPPSYEEAVFLMTDEKNTTVVNNPQNNAEGSHSKETGVNSAETSCSKETH